MRKNFFALLSQRLYPKKVERCTSLNLPDESFIHFLNSNMTPLMRRLQVKNWIIRIIIDKLEIFESIRGSGCRSMPLHHQRLVFRKKQDGLTLISQMQVNLSTLFNKRINFFMVHFCNCRSDTFLHRIAV